MARREHYCGFCGKESDEGKVVDFKNLDKDDTRIDNLRLATPAEDACNRRRNSSSSTGLKGAAVFNSDRNLKHYRASVRVDGKRVHLGQFHTPEEAHAAYRNKVAELHGEFARTD